MSEKEAPAMAQQSKATPKPEPAVDAPPAPPERAGEEFRKEWADANGVDPSEMREIHYPGGWVDRFDGRGWVRREGSE